MDALQGSFGHAAWSQFWQVTLLILVVAVITRLGARNRPHLAHVLWLDVLVKCVTPPVWSSPAGVFCWMLQVGKMVDGRDTELELDSEKRAAMNHVRATPSAAEMESKAFASWEPKSAADSVPIVSEPSTPAQSSIEPRKMKARLTRLPTWNSPTTMFLGSVWMFGSLVIVLTTTVRSLNQMQSIRQSGHQENESLNALLRRLSRRLRLRQSVRVIITRGRVGPAVVGLFHPIIVLPEITVRGKSPEELEPILAHELLHVRRGDLWTGMLQILAQAIWWFHPLVWIVNRMLSREAERCCDEETIAELGCSPSRYARSLLEILKLKRTLIPVAAFPGVRPVEITSRRLERIMELGQGRHNRTPWWCRLLMVVALAISLPGGAMVVARGDRIADAQRSPPQSSSADFSADFRKSDDEAGNPSGRPLKVRIFSVATVMKTARSELDSGRDGARKLLEQFVNAIIGSAGKDRSDSGQDSWTGRSTTGGRSVGDRRQGALRAVTNDIQWFGDELIVRATDSQHEQIASMIDSFGRYGFEQITIEVRVASVPMDLVNSLGNDWTILPSQLPTKRPNGLLAQQETDGSRGGIQPENSTRFSGARMVVAKDLPMTFEIVDEGRAGELVDEFQRNARANIMQCPKVTVFNGQEATIEDTSQRPFVVGVDHGQPRIRVVSEGLSLRLRPRLQEDNSVRLDCRLTLAEIRDVERHAFGQGAKGITVQVPEVATTRVDTAVDFPLGKTLILRSLYKGKKEPSTEESSFDAFRRFITGGSKKQVIDEGKQAIVVMFRVTRPMPGLVRIKDPSMERKRMIGVGVDSDAQLVGEVATEVGGHETQKDGIGTPYAIDDKKLVRDSGDPLRASEIWELSLAECLSTGLQNAKSIRTVTPLTQNDGARAYLGV